jgi:hypothetical protein
MATAGALFIGWGRAVDGREQKALQVFGEAIAYYGRLQQAGTIDGFEAFQLQPHGGDLAGFLILKGDQEKLARLLIDQDFVRLNTRAQLVVTNFGAVLAHTGEDMQQLFADFGRNAAELA